MGKKRSRQQSSNGVVTGDSSESDSAQNTEKSQAAAKVCQHAGKSVDQNQVKKNLHLEDIENNNFCVICSKLGQSVQDDDIWVCLRCGAKACSLDHSLKHNEIPHSDSHALALRLSDKIVMCHECKFEIPSTSNKKLKGCVNNVETAYERHLQGPQPPKNPPKPEPILEEEPSEKKSLEAIPLLPIGARSAPSSGPPVKGLWNLGNTCFFNSVLQCLAQTPNLLESLKELEIPDQEVSINLKSGKVLSGTMEKSDSLCVALAEALTEVRMGGSAFSPLKLLNLFKKRVPQFKGGGQHDSHEFLRNLLDSVRAQDLKRYRKLMLTELGLNGMEMDSVSEEKTKELKQLDKEVKEAIAFVPDQVFRGILVSRLECQECHHSSECVESFLDLSLPVSSERPQPPSMMRRKGCAGSPEEKTGGQMSKHQLKKEKKLERKKFRKHGQHFKKETGQGESSTPTIPEESALNNNSESDAGADDGDVDSEGSGDKKVNNCEGPYPKELTPEGIDEMWSTCPNVSSSNDAETQISDYSKIPLAEDGLPDMSQLSISDASQPQLKTLVRDAATILKEDPDCESRLNGDIEPPNSEIPEENDDRLQIPEPPPAPVSSPSGELPKISEEEAEQSDDEVLVGGLFDEMSSTETSGDCSVQTCLAQFTGIELMTGSNKVGCEQCTARANKGNKEGKTVYTMSTKQLLISKAPPVLILHLKRFQVQMSSFRKLSCHVSFPLEFDLALFCKEETRKKNPKKLLYDLYGIVEHSGTFNGGHYVAYVKVDCGRWYCISDSHLIEVKEARVLQAQAYLLFYKSS